MGYVIALEGTHGAGKSTLAGQIELVASASGDWKKVVNIHHARGDSTPDKLDADMKMVEDAPGDTLYIFDRTYLSELVHAPIEGRRSTIPYDPIYWEEYMGKWIDRRGLRLYLMAEPVFTSSLPVVQMYERMTAYTRWARVEPRKYIGDELAKNLLLAVISLRSRNETCDLPPPPEVTRQVEDTKGDNYPWSIEAVAGLERGLYELRNTEGLLENLAVMAVTQYKEVRKVRDELDALLLSPFTDHFPGE